MDYTFEGVLESCGDLEHVTDRFDKRDFVVRTVGERYEQSIKFQLTQHRCELLDEFDVGQMVSVTFNLTGKAWQGRHFVNLNALSITEHHLDKTRQTNEHDDPDEIPF